MPTRSANRRPPGRGRGARRAPHACEPALPDARLHYYLSTSALNRPFDDLSAERVRQEAEALASVFSAAEAGRVDLVSSDFVEFELAQNPDRERAARVAALLAGVIERVAVTPRLAARTRELERFALRGVDALHIAAAEAAGPDVLVTTDDRMIRRVARAGAHVKVRVVLPAEALSMPDRRRETRS